MGEALLSNHNPIHHILQVLMGGIPHIGRVVRLTIFPLALILLYLACHIWPNSFPSSIIDPGFGPSGVWGGNTIPFHVNQFGGGHIAPSVPLVEGFT